MTTYVYVGYGKCGHLTMFIAEDDPIEEVVANVTSVLLARGIIERMRHEKAVALLASQHCTCKPKPTLRSVP